MKKILLNPASNCFTLNQNFIKYFCLMLILAGISAAAQIGPYARYESIPASIAAMTTPGGFTFSAPSFTRIGTNSRSGTAALQSTTAGYYFETPNITRLKTFSFYVRKVTTTTNQMAYKVEFINNATSAVTDASVYPGVSSVTAAPLPNTTASPSAYQLVTYTFPNTIPVGRIRVTDNRVAGLTGGLVLDDISWDCYKSDGTVYAAGNGYPDNTVVVPIQNGVGATIPNPGGNVNVASGEVYNFYDNGGDSDGYNVSQSNVVTFKPTTTGEKARVTFNSYTGAANDYIEVFYGPTAGTVGTGALYHTATGMPATTWVSTATDGEITVRFVSDAATNAAGFYITVDISPCATIATASVGSVNPTEATVSWSA